VLVLGVVGGSDSAFFDVLHSFSIESVVFVPETQKRVKNHASLQSKIRYDSTLGYL